MLSTHGIGWRGFYDAGAPAYEVAVQIYAADELLEIVALVESKCLG
jgi:hypothetical protein